MYVIYEEETYLILYILSKKIFFGDDDLISDVIIQEPVWKLRHNCRHEINRDPFADNYSFRHNHSFSFFRLIDRADFAVRDPVSLIPTKIYFFILITAMRN